MAKGGGGAWKVAYADFVTAMMAFFLVMWICGQDQKIRQAVSHYFNDPTNASLVGNSKQPSRSGSVSETMSLGSVPQAESVALGRGRKSHTGNKPKAPATKMVSDWLVEDDKSRKYWEDQAKSVLAAAANNKDVLEKKRTAEEVAAQELARQLRTELGVEICAKAKGLQQDLLFEALSHVNWFELAEDLLGR